MGRLEEFGKESQSRFMMQSRSNQGTRILSPRDWRRKAAMWLMKPPKRKRSELPSSGNPYSTVILRAGNTTADSGPDDLQQATREDLKAIAISTIGISVTLSPRGAFATTFIGNEDTWARSVVDDIYRFVRTRRVWLAMGDAFDRLAQIATIVLGLPAILYYTVF